MENFYAQTFDVDSLHVDYEKKFDLCGLMRHFHLAAEKHAYALGVDANTLWREYGAIWIITRIRVEITGDLPVWQQRIDVETYPLAPGLVRLEREATFAREGRRFANLSSEWCMLDAVNGRPRRPAQTGYPAAMPHRDGRVTADFTKFAPEYDETDCIYAHTVRLGDLDMNVHMNNVAYIRLACDAFKVSELKGKKLSSFEIAFKSQSFEGETVGVYRKEAGDGRYYVSAIKTDGTRVFDTIFDFS